MASAQWATGLSPSVLCVCNQTCASVYVRLFRLDVERLDVVLALYGLFFPPVAVLDDDKKVKKKILSTQSRSKHRLNGTSENSFLLFCFCTAGAGWDVSSAPHMDYMCCLPLHLRGAGA